MLVRFFKNVYNTALCLIVVTFGLYSYKNLFPYLSETLQNLEGILKGTYDVPLIPERTVWVTIIFFLAGVTVLSLRAQEEGQRNDK